MPNPHLSILVVDDAKFSSAMIGRALSQAGYQDLRFANSAAEAIRLLEQRPASVLLADWLMPEMNGLELTVQVRQFDEMAHHYTYVILLTGKEGENVLGEAFDSGVDDFISKAAMNEQLVPRVYAADRLCNTLQRLLQENRLLTENIASLEQRNLIDPLTGLGNSRYLHQKMLDSLRQVESRGGALCYPLIGLQDMHELHQRYGDTFYNELLTGVARRLQQELRLAHTLGYSAHVAWWRVGWPQLLPRMTAPLLAVLTYGLSSEYLKSTKEAQAKSKAPDADRSLYRCGGADPSVAGGPHR